jgi:mannosyltransferase
MNIRDKVLPSIFLLLILLLAFGLRFYGLGAQSLWNDEGTSVVLAQRDLVTIAHDAAHDIHPPLYYWLLSGWVRLSGTGETAVRSFSALLGVTLVALTFVLGRRLAWRWVGLGAALLAAIHPFQVVYSQETRMYMLLAVLTAGAMLALLRLVDRASWTTFAALVLLEAAGLYTHYSFAFVALALNMAYAGWLILTWRQTPVARRGLNWGLSQLIVGLLFLPWLPTAIRQVTTWPSPVQVPAFLPALANTWRWLVWGPTIETEEVVLPLLISGLVIIIGGLALAAGGASKAPPQSRWGAGLLALWIGLPVVLMFVLGLYREAYLKFLLVTAPAVGILLACGLMFPLQDPANGPERARRGVVFVLRVMQVAAALFITIPSFYALQNYYGDPAYARDDYRSIASYVEDLGREGDAVLLNAPGQQEVFGIYYQGDLPIYALPENRPLDAAATESSLQELAQPGGRVFALFWATSESDPERFVESWLDSHAYKALDSWYGNVRLVVYAVPEWAPSAPDHALDVPLRNPETGDEIRLLGYSLLDDRLAAGDIAQITLFWQADRQPAVRYKAFVHVLDGENHIVGQRDSEPGGGARLTTVWEPGETVVDNYGVLVHPGTPPGEYRVEVGMYDAEIGQRLVTAEGMDHVWLEPLMVSRPPVPAPAAALDMQHTANARLGELTLLGYDAHKLGFAHQPDAELRAGDVLHINLYWRAETQPRGDWHVTVALVDSDGRKWSEFTAEPVGGYPTSQWQMGDVWRGQFNLSLPGDLPPGRYRLRIQPMRPDGTFPDVFLSGPLEVGS